MIRITRRLEFCAGHRVVGHEGKCKNPHGHNYGVYICAEATGDGELDKIGRVIDFSVLKERIGGWIETHWDHAFIVWKEDKKLLSALNKVEAQVFVLPQNPTAENLASYLLRVVCPAVLDAEGVTVVAVTLYETENCSASVDLLED